MPSACARPPDSKLFCLLYFLISRPWHWRMTSKASQYTPLTLVLRRLTLEKPKFQASLWNLENPRSVSATRRHAHTCTRTCMEVLQCTSTIEYCAESLFMSLCPCSSFLPPLFFSYVASPAANRLTWKVKKNILKHIPQSLYSMIRVSISLSPFL